MTPVRDTRWQDGLAALVKAADRLVFTNGAWPLWRPPADFQGAGATIGDECIRMAVEQGILQVTQRDDEGFATEVQAA